MDSMIAAELRTWLWNTLKIEMSFLNFLSPKNNLEPLVTLVTTRLSGS